MIHTTQERKKEGKKESDPWVEVRLQRINERLSMYGLVFTVFGAVATIMAVVGAVQTTTPA